MLRSSTVTEAALGSERGSVLLLGIGFLGVCLLALAVVADVSAAFLQRRALTAVADAAALAGAQAIDLDSYYEHGATVGTTLDASLVRARVLNHIDRADVARRFPGFRVEEINAGPTVVQVRVSARAQLTFFPEFDGPITVAARARLDLRE
jgi:Flp pilus assembly protein TadG